METALILNQDVDLSLQDNHWDFFTALKYADLLSHAYLQSKFKSSLVTLKHTSRGAYMSGCRVWKYVCLSMTPEVLRPAF